MTRILALAAALAALTAATVTALAAREAALTQAARGVPAHARDAMRALSPDGEW